jgi:hypothetical protein
LRVFLVPPASILVPPALKVINKSAFDYSSFLVIRRVLGLTLALASGDNWGSLISLDDDE